MGNVISTNVSSLNAQRNLLRSGDGLRTTFQRLSSGLRINSARDDAAGLQISNRLTSQIGGLQQAARNANDGISLAQTAEGALQEATVLLQRIRDLAVQSANGSNSGSERAALSAEVGQLQAELNRISDTTAFGGKKLLDGTFGSQTFQVGALANETVTVSIGSSSGILMGRNSYDLDGTIYGDSSAAGTAPPATNGLSAATLAVTGSLGNASITIPANSEASDVALLVNQNSPQTGVNADARNVVHLSSFGTGSVSLEITGFNTAPVSVAGSIADSTDLSAIANAINQFTGQTGVTAVASNDGNLSLISDRGNDIGIGNFTTSSTADNTLTVQSQNFDNTAAAASATTITLTSGANDSTLISGVVRLDGGANGFTFSGAATEFAAATSGGSSLTSVATIDIASAEGAQSAITVVDGAIGSIDSFRASLGGIQNRLLSTISNLNSVAENAAAARSRIRDTDYALETSELAKNQVLQQAGLSVLSQANAASQSVLTLLQG